MKNLMLLMIIAILMVACESKSGRLNKLPQEPPVKVVVVDEDVSSTAPNGTGHHLYKVKTSDGVSCYVRSAFKYEKDDTILISKHLILK